ncbi:MAG: ABC transporter ATP-binding protein [Myxococcota bacterium]
MIELIGAGKSWDNGTTWTVRDVDLTVADGSFLAIVGESGSGKTTTLKLMNRLVEPSAGTVRVFGEDIANTDEVHLRRRMGWVLQAIALFPHWTVARNIEMVPRLLGWDPDRITARVDELLTLVGLPPEMYRERLPSQLSGGQRQRIGVARALAAEPPILLMDEPFGALDPVTRDALQRDVKQLHNDLGLTTVMVTHDMAEALTLADQVAVMKDGELVRVGTPHELLTRPDNAYVHDLIQTPLRHASALKALAETP